MAEPLTKLEQTVLEVDALGLTLRDSIKLVTQRVGFFVGQERYEGELRKARRKLGQSGAQAEAR